MSDHLSEEINENSLLILDDAAGEIADLIKVDKTDKLITLYHCKGRQKNSSGTLLFF